MLDGKHANEFVDEVEKNIVDYSVSAIGSFRDLKYLGNDLNGEAIFANSDGLYTGNGVGIFRIKENSYPSITWDNPINYGK
jgi:hypothetical protein